MYSVNEVFASVQGEGVKSGCPAVFIRFQGCTIGCDFCDTPYALGPGRSTTMAAMLAKRRPSSSWALMTSNDLARCLQRWPSIRHVVITGGEPLIYDLSPLVRVIGNRALIQVETSGTRPILLPPNVWVTVSPKPGYLRASLSRADELKVVVSGPADVEFARGLAREYPDKTISLQPQSASPAATRLSVAACLGHGFRLSVQLHKQLRLR